MQIQKKYDNELISEIAYMCNDLSFNDFPKTEYAQAVFRCQRDLAKTYRILERYISLKVEKEDLTGDILLPIYNFISEFKVKLNKSNMLKVNEVINDYEYRIYFNTNNSWVFDYKNRTLNDEIEIYYTVNGDDISEQQGNIILPEIYYDELMKKVIVRISQLGLVKYHNNDKEYKYRKLLQIFNDGSRKPELERNDAWSTLKIYNGLGD